MNEHDILKGQLNEQREREISEVEKELKSLIDKGMATPEEIRYYGYIHDLRTALSEACKTCANDNKAQVRQIKALEAEIARYEKIVGMNAETIARLKACCKEPNMGKCRMICCPHHPELEGDQKDSDTSAKSEEKKTQKRDPQDHAVDLSDHPQAPDPNECPVCGSVLVDWDNPLQSGLVCSNNKKCDYIKVTKNKCLACKHDEHDDKKCHCGCERHMNRCHRCNDFLEACDCDSKFEGG